MHGGGNVLGTTVLKGKPHSANMALNLVTLEQLRLKHGQQVENWWKQRFGFRFDCLTKSEALYLLNTPDVLIVSEIKSLWQSKVEVAKRVSELARSNHIVRQPKAATTQ